jgi:WD40 repeat protein
MRLGAVVAQYPPRGAPVWSIREWDLTSGQERTVATPWVATPVDDSTDDIGGFSYSPDGGRLAFTRGAARDSERVAIVMLDATTGAQLWTAEARGTTFGSLLWSPDGQIMAMTDWSSAPVQLFDTATGRLLRVLRSPSAATAALAFRSGGAELVAVDSQGNLKEWDLGPTARNPASMPPRSNGTVLELAIQADGSTMAEVREPSAADSLSIAVRKTRRGPELGRIDSPRLGPGSQVRMVRLSPDGSTVAFAEYLNERPSANTGQLREWQLTVADVVRHRLVRLSRRELGETIKFPSRLEFRPDGRALAVLDISGAQVQVRDVTDGHLLTKWSWSVDTRRFRITQLAFRPDGQALAIPLRDRSIGSTRTIVQVHDVRDGRLLDIFEGDAHTTENIAADYWDNPRDVVFAPDGSRVAQVHAASSGSTSSQTPDAGALLIWDTRRPGTAPLRFAGAPSLPMQMAFSPDGRRIAVVGRKSFVSGEGV